MRTVVSSDKAGNALIATGAKYQYRRRHPAFDPVSMRDSLGTRPATPIFDIHGGA
jgi:hypothetical protein